jgi:hypothetical protein
MLLVRGLLGSWRLERRLFDGKLFDRRLLGSWRLERRLFDGKLFDRRLLGGWRLERGLFDGKLFDRRLLRRKLLDGRLLDGRLLGTRLRRWWLLCGRFFKRRLVGSGLFRDRLLGRRLLIRRLFYLLAGRGAREALVAHDPFRTGAVGAYHALHTNRLVLGNHPRFWGCVCPVKGEGWTGNSKRKNGSRQQKRTNSHRIFPSTKPPRSQRKRSSA